MNWTNLTSSDKSDAPRRLTKEEVDLIVDNVPYAPAADEDAAKVNREGVMSWVRAALSDLELCPSAVPEMIAAVVDYHRRSMIAPGTPVGIIAAEAVGSTTTQMTLNTFHSSGSSNSVEFGIEAMKDIIFARKTPKNEGSTIYYTDKSMSYEDVLNTRREIVGVTISDFVVDYAIDSPDNFDPEWWTDGKKKLFTVPKSTVILRLYLNTVEMFKHHVSMRDIAAALERETPSSCKAVYGPISRGILDIYPEPEVVLEIMNNILNKNQDTEVDPALAETTYLETVVYNPELSKIRVKGLTGITSLFPVVSPVWRMVLKEEPFKVEKSSPLYSVAERGNAWCLFVNKEVMKTTGLLFENLAALCQNVGISLVGRNDLYLLVQMPSDAYRAPGGGLAVNIDGSFYKRVEDAVVHDGRRYRLVDPNISEKGDLRVSDAGVRKTEKSGKVKNINGALYREIVDVVEIDDDLYEEIPSAVPYTPGEYVAMKVAEEKKTSPGSDLILSSEFIIAETRGQNLKQLLSLPGIDKTRTTCNNMYTVCSTLGIEAARNTVVRSLYNAITNAGSYVHPVNILLIGEFITSRGEPNGATYVGISRQPGGHLSLATLERAGEVFTGSALYGMKEDIRNVSASVAVGTRMAIGDGYFDVAQEKEDGEILMNNQLFSEKPISVEDLSSGIDALKNAPVSDNFDLASGEDADLLNAFGNGEMVQDVTNRMLPRTSDRINTVKNPNRLPAATVGKSSEEVDEGPIVADRERPTSSEGLVSEGLVSDEEEEEEIDGEGLPLSLRALLDKYKKRSPISTRVVPLPAVPVKRLPNLGGVDLSTAYLNLRREQLANLEPIDTQKLASALQ